MSLPRRAPLSEDLTTQTEPTGFLSRWSRRKLGNLPDDASAHVHQADAPVQLKVQPEPHNELGHNTQAMPVVAEPDSDQLADQPPAEAIDAYSGKPFSELTDEDMPDVDSLTADSDLRGFMSGKVSQALRNKALSKVFHSAKYNKFCICAEYADDYTNFLPMGDIVPHDLKSAIAREAGKLVKRLAEQGLEMSPEQAQAHMASEFRGEKPELPPLPRTAADGADDAPQQVELEPDQRLSAAEPAAQRENP